MAAPRGKSVPVNPLWSARTRDELVLAQMRPADLPQGSPEGLNSMDGVAENWRKRLYTYRQVVQVSDGLGRQSL